MTIYQQELLRKLPRLGCEGRMDETDETLYVTHQKEALLLAVVVPLRDIGQPGCSFDYDAGMGV